MNIFALGLAACVFFMVPAEAYSQTREVSGTIEFTGKIVEGGCEYSVYRQGDSAEASRLIEVAPHVVISVSGARNECRSEAVPFVTSYRNIYNPSVGHTSEVRNGVVTISYL